MKACKKFDGGMFTGFHFASLVIGRTSGLALVEKPKRKRSVLVKEKGKPRKMHKESTDCDAEHKGNEDRLSSKTSSSMLVKPVTSMENRLKRNKRRNCSRDDNAEGVFCCEGNRTARTCSAACPPSQKKSWKY